MSLASLIWALIILTIATIGAIGGNKEREFWTLFLFAWFWIGVGKLALYLRKRMDVEEVQ